MQCTNLEISYRQRGVEYQRATRSRVELSRSLVTLMSPPLRQLAATEILPRRHSICSRDSQSRTLVCVKPQLDLGTRVSKWFFENFNAV